MNTHYCAECMLGFKTKAKLDEHVTKPEHVSLIQLLTCVIQVVIFSTALVSYMCAGEDFTL